MKSLARPSMLLSFDVEEFDMPLENGMEISLEEQLEISDRGTHVLLDFLRKEKIAATFFCTVNFAQHRPDTIRLMVQDGHAIASHTWYHSAFKTEDLLASRLKLEEISGTRVISFRMPRMMPVDSDDLSQAGYLINSSMNPTWIPGRYNHLNQPRTWFRKKKILHIPSSVSPLLRFPLFWLGFHNLPFGMLKFFCSQTLKKDGYLNIYFHPWEFVSLHDSRLGMPSYVKRKSGSPMLAQLSNLVHWAKTKDCTFQTIDDYGREIFSASVQ